MSEYSTKISDLPDNTSSRVLNDLREDISIISESEDQDLEPEQVELQKEYFLKKKKSKKSKIFTEKNLKIIYDSILVFVLMMNTNNQQILSKIPYLVNYLQNPGSLMYNAIIATITAILYIIIKVLLEYYYYHNKK